MLMEPVYIVKRLRQGVLVKTYGPFAERGEPGRTTDLPQTAEGAATLAAQKHRGCLVLVEAVHPLAVRR